MANFTELVNGVRQVFRSGRTVTYEWRRTQLEGMLKLLDENMDKLTDALYKDLHKAKAEAMMMELNMVRNEVINTMNSLTTWMKPEKVKKELINIMDTCYIKSEPYGVVLILGAWNYPIQLSLLPLIGALSAGNCAILKPSEISQNCAQLIEQLIPKYLDNDCVKVVNGGVPETTALLSERFDYIFYTGNNVVAKIVMAAAAKYLTPVTLELGGKSPVYVDRNVNMEVVARRILWGKCSNAGQTCIAPDYVLCSKDVQDQLIEQLKKIIPEFYSENPVESGHYGRIVNERHFQRVKKLMQSGTVAIGGDVKDDERFISPTVLRDVKVTDPAMQDEIFGPVLPIITVGDDNEAIDVINSREKPLALYIFSNNKRVVHNFLNRTSSGGVCVNDTLMHISIPTLPFGGVGHSGVGSYHGKFSFETFSHRRSVMERGLTLDSVNAIRYPPYTEKKLQMVSWLSSQKVKKTGFFSFFPFVIIGTVVAFLFKALGIHGKEVSHTD
ncbi:aldehyde dehydrogenase, dimeric NADP-preferring-like [Gigantopelta aegis]|uniref:aldehyde dehydrogenase, dimeric NADP-preferring-like n=1 Tax=Gigantopelta aegis TaxID=1735272 RepID=UPI001B88A9C2|nr:aldehyde dehydrogenase, dimeric NADP-preferring-like [Gigantopelta aegis]